jgi:hypothetical protein
MVNARIEDHAASTRCHTCPSAQAWGLNRNSPMTTRGRSNAPRVFKVSESIMVSECLQTFSSQKTFELAAMQYLRPYSSLLSIPLKTRALQVGMTNTRHRVSTIWVTFKPVPEVKVLNIAYKSTNIRLVELIKQRWFESN